MEEVDEFINFVPDLVQYSDLAQKPYDKRE